MLEEIIRDQITRVEATNQQMFDSEVDFEEVRRHERATLVEWKRLSESERKKYRDQPDFMQQNGARDLKDVNLIPAKNFSILRMEAREQINPNGIFQLLPIDYLDFDDSLIELAESIENIAEIRELYKIRKRTVGTTGNAGISAEEAKKLKNCFSQGRELYLSGKNGSLMVKPLNFFYSLTAYTYGIIILNNPLRYRKDMLPGSHGMSYLPAEIQAQIGGDSPRGTFSDLVTAFPTHLIKKGEYRINIDCVESILAFYKIRFSVCLGTLLSMVPEMKDSRCYPLEIVNANDSRTLTWDFYIGDGEYRPTVSAIEQSFPGFERSDRYGKTIITVPAARASSIKSCIYTDIRGNLWFVENPFFPVILPEVSVHFLIASIFSNIMRYRPDEWGSVLLNDVRSEISLLTRHYFSSFQKNFFC